MSGWTKGGLALGLMAIAALTLWRPALLLAPGTQNSAHAALADHCFACHAPLGGVSAARCTACHRLAEIGRLTTRHEPLPRPRMTTAFHQQLLELRCSSCHSEHAGVGQLRSRHKFEHALLRPESRALCADCHAPPQDALHIDLRAQCNGCHSIKAWRPADFDHGRYFVLDGNHAVRCLTCHADYTYARYTCYGCHEHRIDRIRDQHDEASIRSLNNCVKCHRSTSEHAEGE
jgi:Class III cytochrome C family